ncbi:hypothetical protein J2W24_004747 [Variovorax boronicumulans]|uniref:hypothetical protein n=1 Tax=Variovorax boronicumulans TaxID=436515 RepID=UPI0027851DCB|nr:hypothetical protein [Variovorax boronicumulans]MDP9919078.1 hypothetical protein [Variovorax boronicumulans]
MTINIPIVAAASGTAQRLSPGAKKWFDQQGRAFFNAWASFVAFTTLPQSKQ